MSHISNELGETAVNTANSDRWLLGHDDLRGFVRHAGAVYRICLLILMECRTGNMLHWIVLPFQRDRYINVADSFLEFLIVPALRSNRRPPATLCIETDPDSPLSIAPFFTSLANNGGPNIPLDMTSTLDDAKLATFFERVELYLGETFDHLHTAGNESELPTLEELKTTIDTYIADWNNQVNRWEN
jgi:hypothetical protein